TIVRSSSGMKRPRLSTDSAAQGLVCDCLLVIGRSSFLMVVEFDPAIRQLNASGAGSLPTLRFWAAPELPLLGPSCLFAGPGQQVYASCYAQDQEPNAGDDGRNPHRREHMPSPPSFDGSGVNMRGHLLHVSGAPALETRPM